MVPRSQTPATPADGRHLPLSVPEADFNEDESDPAPQLVFDYRPLTTRTFVGALSATLGANWLLVGLMWMLSTSTMPVE